MYKIGILSLTNGETFNENMANFSENYQIKKEKTRKKVSEWRRNKVSAKNVTSYVPVSNPSKVKGSKVKESKVNISLRDFKKQNPEAVDICNHFIKTLDPGSRYIPKTDAKKLAWLKCSRWAINKMGKNGKEKVEDIITFYRSGDADNNGFSWVENWQSLLKIQKKNKEEVFYLDYFYEKAKNNFVYGKSGINQENVIKRLKSELQHLDSGVYKNVSEVVAIFQGKAKEIVLEKLKDMNYIKKSLKL